MHPQITPKTIVASENCIFFDVPKKLQINEDAVTRFATSNKIELLIQELKEKGPMVALGQMGPTVYKEEPFKLQVKIGEYEIYGWKPGTARKEHPKSTYFLILGANKINDKEIVYYTPSEDITLNTSSYMRTHSPSRSDTKIYAVSIKTFNNYLTDLYPPVTTIEKPKNSSGLSPLEQGYAEALASIMPLDSILDNGEGQKKCKAIGQKAFDEFKKNANGNTWTAKEAVQNICDSLVSFATDGKLRKQYVERAWDGIGDDNWRWMA